MPKNSGLRVYVLGAGCSYDEQHGYPLAKGFLSELETYATKIQGRKDCQRIEQSVQQTVELLKHYQSGQYQASTIDQLINLVLTKKCDDYLCSPDPRASERNASIRVNVVRNAKISTAACFLEKEGQVMARLMPKYKAFIRSIFYEGMVKAPCSARLQHSNARVFSFNYDRLFELAFFGAGIVDDDSGNSEPYKVLNSGLNFKDTENLQIMESGFSFVKMHGSVGVRCNEELGYSPNLFRDGDIAHWNQLEVADEMFFSPCKPNELPHSPLIVFPYDKHFILDGKRNKITTREYISKIWGHAENVFKEAMEIFIIGYSFSDERDSKYLVDLMRSATNCRQIEIQNLPGECARISNLLKDKHGFKVPIKINTLKF